MPYSDDHTSIRDLKERVASFARDRDWDQFHSPKNLSMALAVEVAELMELFQWKTERQSWEINADPEAFAKVRDEIGDIAIFILNLCNRVGVDLASAVITKLEHNAIKYPIELARGKALKYTEYPKTS